MDEQDYKIAEQLGTKYPEFQKQAGLLKHKVMVSENTRLINGEINYSEMQQRMATVHTREDLILVVSYMGTLISTLKTICWLLIAIVGLLVFIALK